MTADAQRTAGDLLDGLKRLGFDEISIRKGQSYLRRPRQRPAGVGGRDRKTVERFLDRLGDERCKRIELVSCDMAEWITRPIAERCPNAQVWLDPFHVTKLVTEALDEIRREVWNEARRAGEIAVAKELKGARFALWNNPDKLTPRQKLKLAHIQKINQRLYRGYLIAQQQRLIYRLEADEALTVLDTWLKWARRCRLPPFAKAAKTITQQRAGIEAAIRNQLSNARVEQINTQIRLITRRGFSYQSQEAVIALAMLSLGGLCPPLLGR